MVESSFRNVNQLLSRIARTKWVQHVGFWSLYLSPTVYFFLNACTIQEAIAPLMGFVLITLGSAYFNLNVLVDRYLIKDKFIGYIGVVILLLAVTCALYTQWYLISLKHFFNVQNEQSFRQAYWGNIFDLGVMLVLTTTFKLSKDRYRQQQLNKQLTNENLTAEIRLLRSQFNSHFLFNTMNNLYALSIKKSDKTSEAILKLSSLIEYMLYESGEELVSLESEMNYLKNYIEVERLRHQDLGEVEFIQSGEVRDKSIAPFILAPFVENAFKHGDFGLVKHSFVRCSFTVTGEVLDFVVENSKPTVPVTEPKTKSVGLANVRKRLELLYTNTYELEIDQQEKQFRIHLKLNLVQ